MVNYAQLVYWSVENFDSTYFCFQNQCSLPGILRPGQEVANPLVQEDLMEQSLSSGEHFTSIAHTTLDSSDFVFAGTNGGNLYQVRQSSMFEQCYNLCCEGQLQQKLLLPV